MVKATLKDVAEASGVSVATVSYVLNNNRSALRISQATVQRVLKASKELQYKPDMIARMLVEQKRQTLSLAVFSPWLYSQFSDFMVQVNHAIREVQQKEKLTVDYMHFAPDSLKSCLTPAKCRKYDAVIVIGTSPADELFLDKKCRTISNIILLNRVWHSHKYSCSNDEECCTGFAERLLKKGYYNKYVLSYAPRHSRREGYRISGYTGVFSVLGSNFCKNEINMHDGKNDCFRDMLERYGKERVCYIFTQYFPAAGFLNFAVRRQISVPEQIGVVGYDMHSLLSDFLTPQLTTVDPRIMQMTMNALDIARALKHGEECDNKIVEAVVELGGSVIL